MQLLSNQQKGIFYAINSGLCFGLLGYLGISIINTGISTFTMLFWRFFIAAFFVNIFMKCINKPFINAFHENIKILVYGITFYSFTAITYFYASLYIGTGLAMVIFFTYPAFVIILNTILYKKTIHKHYYSAFLLILIGMTFLVDLQKATFDLVGIGLSLLSSALYACYVIGSKKSSLPPLQSTLMVTIGCSITCLALSLWQGTFNIPQTLQLWATMISLAIICTALPILLLLQSLKYISAEKASMLSVLEPVFVVIIGILLLGETITTLQLLGILIILFGALTTINKKSA